MKIHDTIHQRLLKHLPEVNEWFKGKREGIAAPFYSSYDIRDSGCKVVIVDANIYPAGFNNICQTDKDYAGDLARAYLRSHYGESIQKILLITEEHTNNPYYWENVGAITDIITQAGFEVKVAVPDGDIQNAFDVTSIGGRAFHVEVYRPDKPLEGFKPDLIISNNDFSKNYEVWASKLEMPVNPPRELGWYRRKKSLFFEEYNALASEFARVIDLDPMYLTVKTKLFQDFDVAEEASRERLAEAVDHCLNKLKEDYARVGLNSVPYVFVKNNSGTYGLGVTQVGSGAEVLQWNYKSKKKMKAAKGGRDVSEVIIQEGVPSSVRSEQSSAEPVIYMLGCRLAGGFLRTHQEKTERESLNSPGAVYRRLCVSDLQIDVEGNPLENVYGWVAKLAVLAVGRESAKMDVNYANFRLKNCPE